MSISNLLLKKAEERSDGEIGMLASVMCREYTDALGWISREALEDICREAEMVAVPRGQVMVVSGGEPSDYWILGGSHRSALIEVEASDPSAQGHPTQGNAVLSLANASPALDTVLAPEILEEIFSAATARTDASTPVVSGSDISTPNVDEGSGGAGSMPMSPMSPTQRAMLALETTAPIETRPPIRLLRHGESFGARHLDAVDAVQPTTCIAWCPTPRKEKSSDDGGGQLNTMVGEGGASTVVSMSGGRGLISEGVAHAEEGTEGVGTCSGDGDGTCRGDGDGDVHFIRIPRGVFSRATGDVCSKGETPLHSYSCGTLHSDVVCSSFNLMLCALHLFIQSHVVCSTFNLMLFALHSF